jgi:putative flippase GtrA
VTRQADPARRAPADRFLDLCAAVVRRLPFGLSRAPATFLGFTVINSSTFALDLGLLALCHQVLGLRLPVAFTVGYVTAFAISFGLNRALNFQSHAPMGRQVAVFVVVVAINYVAIILGVGTGLAALGVPYLLARVMAGWCEAVFLYCAMRWVVFRVQDEPVRAEDAGPAPVRDRGLPST